MEEQPGILASTEQADLGAEHIAEVAALLQHRRRSPLLPVSRLPSTSADDVLFSNSFLFDLDLSPRATAAGKQAGRFLMDCSSRNSSSHAVAMSAGIFTASGGHISQIPGAIGKGRIQIFELPGNSLYFYGQQVGKAYLVLPPACATDRPGVARRPVLHQGQVFITNSICSLIGSRIALQLFCCQLRRQRPR